MLCIKIEDGRIAQVVDSEQPPQGFVSVPDSFVFVGDDVRYYDADWTPKGESALVDEGVIAPERIVYEMATGHPLTIREFEVPEGYTLQRPEIGQVWNGDGWVTPPPSVDELCQRIDRAADSARLAVAGDPLRAIEYDRARAEAEAFAAADYQGDVPPMVAAWAINGRTPQQAADDILAEAARYTAALVQLRQARLAAKEQVRTLMAAGQAEQAQQLAEQTVAAIQAAVAGVGNNA